MTEAARTLTDADLCAWEAARDRFRALLSELNAQIVSAS